MPGIEFSTESEPAILMQMGFHYIRLTIRNNKVFEEVVSDAFGVLGTNISGFDFVELEIEVRD